MERAQVTTTEALAISLFLAQAAYMLVALVAGLLVGYIIGRTVRRNRDEANDAQSAQDTPVVVSRAVIVRSARPAHPAREITRR